MEDLHRVLAQGRGEVVGSHQSKWTDVSNFIRVQLNAQGLFNSFTQAIKMALIRLGLQMDLISSIN